MPIDHAFRNLTAQLTRLAAAAFAVALLAGNCAAEPAYSFASTPGKLPKTVVPTHYAIELEPNLESLTLAGAVAIDIEVREPTAQLVLNAENMALSAATIDGQAQGAVIAVDDDAETATLTFPQPLAVGPHKLRIAFTGEIRKSGPGLYVVDYQTEKGSRQLLSSHFAPAAARRMFPCWDEPAFKATFALTVTVPRAFTAIGNMPVSREEPVTPTLKQVAFATTPKMSTYLLELTLGELERLTAQADGVAVSVITIAGKREQGRFALDSAITLLRYFNDYSGLKYPLPKLDLIAVPRGHVSAMEHWGAITFRENRLLFDPATSAGTARRGIFTLIAHEIAHQWFGNLVTMAWWDNLWLNEGFATWMEAKATEHFQPRWQTWLNGNGSKQSAMSSDARGTARAIRKPVANESEASAMFDGITYNKGAAVVRMLEAYVGEAVFRDGLRRYLAAHAYGNTTTADLWAALEAASGKPVGALAATFIEQPGLPLVISETTCAGDEQRIVLRQQRFAISDGGPTISSPTDGDGTASRWQVPIAIGPLRALQPAETVLLDGERKEIAAGRCGEPMKLNFGDIGYYRVEYDAATRTTLAKSLALMAPADRLNMLTDGWALVEAARASPAAYFELVDEIGSDDTRPVWEQVDRIIRRLDRFQRGRPERQAYQVYARAKLRPVLDRLGWDEPQPGADAAGPLRTRLIQTLGELGDGDALAEARRRFAAFEHNPASLRPGLRDAVIHLVGLSADKATYDTLLSLARRATNSTERERYYVAAAGARDPELVHATLDLTLTDEVPSNLVGELIHAVASPGDHPDLAWAFLRQNFEALAAKQGAWFRNHFVSDFMRHFSDRARADELASFAPAHETSGSRAAATRTAATIRFDADLKDRVLPAIDEWVKRHGGRDNETNKP